MAAITAGIAAAGALASAYGAQQNARQAGRALSAQEQQAQQDLAFRQQMYNRYLGLYGPTEEKLAAEAQSSQPLDYGPNAAAIKQQYANALRNINTSMGMRGIAGSGLDVGALRGAALGEAGALSGAYAQGLTNRRNLGLALTGRGQIGQAAGAYEGGMQNLANLYGQQAGMYNQAAGMGWQGFGQNLGNLGYALQSQNQPPAGAFGITGNPAYGASFANNWGQPMPTVDTGTAPAGGTFNGMPIY